MVEGGGPNSRIRPLFQRGQTDGYAAKYHPNINNFLNWYINFVQSQLRALFGAIFAGGSVELRGNSVI